MDLNGGESHDGTGPSTRTEHARRLVDSLKYLRPDLDVLNTPLAKQLPPMSSAAVSALGAIIGYLGAEVVEASIFERLLWPERFYNYLDPTTLLKLAVFGSMSGPLHRAALETLDRFRDHGLYKGYMRGDMLGTAIYTNKQGIRYYHRTAAKLSDREVRKEIRNGFWVEVLSHVENNLFDDKLGAIGPTPLEPELGDVKDRPDSTHAKRRERKVNIRAMRRIYHLHLEFCTGKSDPAAGSSNCVSVSEQHITISTVIGVIISEAPSIVFGLAAAFWRRFDRSDSAPATWYTGFVFIPLLIKLLTLLVAVRRTKLILPPDRVRDGVITHGKLPAAATPDERLEIFEVDYPTLGFVLISTRGPISDAAFQFFRHYGHPERASYADRAREVACIAIVYAIGLYFPTGLILLSWMNNATQYLWLSQQAYTVFASHVLRLAGLQGYGRTEERIARQLILRKKVFLLGDDGSVKASLSTEDVPSVQDGRNRVRDILRVNGG